MKAPNFIFTALLFFALTGQILQAQVSGMAILAGQSNHSGIKVKFMAASGTAVTDSCFTSASGNYSISISGGLYSVSFDKSGYQTNLYNSGNAVALTNTVVIPSLTLAAGSASYVSGAVSGTWISGTTYFVQGNLNVAANTTLFIQPGTQVKFLGNYSITVNGALNAVGTVASPIRFSPANPAQAWGTLDLNAGPNILDFCELDHYYSLTNWNANSSITNCRLSYSDIGIQLVDGVVLIENNDIFNAKLAGVIGSATSGKISCNRISAPLYKNDFNYSNWGLHINGSELVTDNTVYDCQVGVYIYNWATNPRLMNNYIHDNLGGLMIDQTNSASLHISNNTFYQNRTAIYNLHSGLILSNNIVASSSLALLGVGMTCDHNLFFNCSTNFSLSNAPTGLGQIVNTNSNGDPIDSYYNLFMNPGFGSQMPFVQAGSPALNAGNASYSPFIGVGYSSNSCFSATVTSLAENKMQNGFSIYPNPSNGIYTAELSEGAKIHVYDLTGKEVLSQGTVQGTNIVDISEYPGGIYFCVIEGPNGLGRMKLIKL